MIKYLAIIMIAVCLIGSIMLSVKAQEPKFITLKSGETIDVQTYYDRTNKVLGDAITDCNMAILLQLNATNIITCQQAVFNFDKVVCHDPDLAPNIDVCRYGIVKHFVERNAFNNDTSIGE
jgi:hypothetical protein